jgi:zinc/manganese transport system substrate-binding protein/manganese/iron transport system substrate-binding protein
MFRLALVMLLFIGFTGCSSGQRSSDDGRLRVVSTTTQIGDFAREVGGDRISLTVLLKPNQEAHDFEPTASQLRTLSRASLVLTHGIGLDDFTQKALQGSNVTAVNVTKEITLRSLEGEDDPHVWFDVANAKLMVAAVRDALRAADPANAAIYEQNSAAYLQRLDQLNAQIKSEVGSIPARCRKLVTNHDVLGYYAAAYGFEILGSIIPSVSADARASAADVANIVRLVRAQNVPAIFAEVEVNPALIRQVGREANVRVVDDLYGDSLGPKNSDGATYIGMMQANTRKIVDALKACGT